MKWKMKRLTIFLFLIVPCWAAAEDVNDLFSAAIMGNTSRVEALLAQGLDVNGLTTGGRTALMGASYKGNIRVIKTLLAYGADVNVADNRGTTALMDALMFGDEAITKLLIAVGADVNAMDKQNLTVLDRAKKIGNERIIKILEQAGAAEPPSTPEETVEAGEATAEGENSGADEASAESGAPGEQITQ